jgi:hypothetical protein
MPLKVSQIKKERSVRNYVDWKRDSKPAVRTVGGNEFQQSVDLLNKEQHKHNSVDPLVGLSKVGRGVVKERDGI